MVDVSFGAGGGPRRPSEAEHTTPRSLEIAQGDG